MTPTVQPFFEEATCTFSYVVYGKPGGPCAIIDSVLDYDPKSGRVRTGSADRLVAFVRQQRLQLHWILETHAHADHMSAARHLRDQLGGEVVAGLAITAVQKVFKGLFNLEPDFPTDGRQFDHLMSDGETLPIGELQLKAIATPGHTPACMAYQVGDAVFVGDTLFMPDVGTARCDFPGGDAHLLYQSIRKLLDLPPQTRLFMCHDYPPEEREPQCQSTVADERERNIHVHDGVSEAQFVAMRTARDATLEMPNLILPSIQVNIRGGAFPPPEANGVSYLKIPINAL
jgi:glyoxylase-like metal-dependent hydrolase (beta-lactamase superfamily II)